MQLADKFFLLIYVSCQIYSFVRFQIEVKNTHEELASGLSPEEDVSLLGILSAMQQGMTERSRLLLEIRSEMNVTDILSVMRPVLVKSNRRRFRGSKYVSSRGS